MTVKGLHSLPARPQRIVQKGGLRTRRPMPIETLLSKGFPEDAPVTSDEVRFRSAGNAVPCNWFTGLFTLVFDLYYLYYLYYFANLVLFVLFVLVALVALFALLRKPRVICISCVICIICIICITSQTSCYLCYLHYLHYLCYSTNLVLFVLFALFALFVLLQGGFRIMMSREAFFCTEFSIRS